MAACLIGQTLQSFIPCSDGSREPVPQDGERHDLTIENGYLLGTESCHLAAGRAVAVAFTKDCGQLRERKSGTQRTADHLQAPHRPGGKQAISTFRACSEREQAKLLVVPDRVDANARLARKPPGCETAACIVARHRETSMHPRTRSRVKGQSFSGPYHPFD